MTGAKIRFTVGDIHSELAEALVNTVNCVGVMGRGVALQFKKVYPDNFKAYQSLCKQGKMRPGQVFVFETDVLSPKYIINFPTKRHWRGKSRIEDIEAGLVSLAEEIRARRISSVAIPPLGSGLGGLEWSTVRQRILDFLKELEGVEVVVFEPGSGPADNRINRSRDVPAMTPGRAVLVQLMQCYNQALLDPYVTLLEVHKLMYFMQIAGEPLRLRFRKARYGPYADNLRHVLNAVEGHLVSGYADGGDNPQKRLDLVPGAVKDARAFLEQCPDTKDRFLRVADLVEGFESSFGMELLSTVHWVVDKECAASVADAIRGAYAWSPRKRQFTERQIRIAVNKLTHKGWIPELGTL